MSGPYGLVRWSRWLSLGLLKLLSPAARDVGQVLAAHESRREGSFPSVTRIAKLTGLSRRSVFMALGELRSLGVYGSTGRKARVSGGAGPRVYFLTPPPENLDALEKQVFAKSRGVTRFTSGATGAEVQPAALQRCNLLHPELLTELEPGIQTGSSGARRVGAGAPRPPRPATGPAPSQRRAGKVNGGGAPLQNAGALKTYTSRELEVLAGVALPPTSLGNPDGASSAGGRVSSPASPSESKGVEIEKRSSPRPAFLRDIPPSSIRFVEEAAPCGT